VVWTSPALRSIASPMSIPPQTAACLSIGAGSGVAVHGRQVSHRITT
jgi:hypothetical protein